MYNTKKFVSQILYHSMNPIAQHVGLPLRRVELLRTKTGRVNQCFSYKFVMPFFSKKKKEQKSFQVTNTYKVAV